MRVFLKCVAEAIAEKGIGGLASLVPGGAFAFAVASAALKKYRERKKDAEIRAEIQQLATASFEDAKRVAAEVAREAVANGPVEDRISLELYLSRIPGAVRKSLTRAEDPTGRTVPNAFALATAEDVLRLLPGQSRFKPGDAVEGLPGWALVEPLGEGGFGEVWLARNGHAGQCGAIKFCREDRPVKDLLHERAVIERVMKAGAHPHVVPLLAARLEGKTPWLMYEYVPGPGLGEWVHQFRSRPAEERVRQAVLALRQLCPAVAHFHRLKPAIVHRDLKPDNIRVDRTTKQLRITDFGIGAVLAKTTVETGDGTTTKRGKLPESLRQAHSLLYASPQQCTGAPPDPRDDVHALGVIAYQLLTGQLDHGPGVDFADELRAVGVSTALTELIGECVARNPARRPADADELYRRVQSLPATLVATPVRPAGALTVFVRCGCCNLPIPATADDIGLTVTCPRTRKLVPVREADFPRSATPKPTSPPPLPTGTDSGSRPHPRPVAQPVRREQDEPAESVPPRRKRRQFAPATVVLIGVLGLVALLSLGGVLWKLSRTGPVAATTEPQLRPHNEPAVPPNPTAPAPEPRVTPPRPVEPRGGEPVPPLVAPVIPAPAAPKVDPDVGPAAATASALVLRVAVEAALDSCAAAAKDADPTVRRRAANGLASFLGHPDEPFRLRAIQALAEMGADAEPALPAIQEATKDPDRDIRTAARSAVEKIGEALTVAKAAKTREALLAFAKDVKAKEPAKRIKALEQIATYGAEANFLGELLIDAMADPVPAVREAASGVLEKVNPKVHPHVFTILYGMNKVQAADDLAVLGADAVIAVPLLLYCHQNNTLSARGSDTFHIVVKIAPKNKQFAAAVLAQIAAARALGSMDSRRATALGYLDGVDAEPADKVKALIAALADGMDAVRVITALKGFGKDAEPALPLLKKLKLSPDDAVRKAATDAIAKIE